MYAVVEGKRLKASKTTNFVNVRRRTEALFSPLAGCNGAVKDWSELNLTLDLGRLSGERNLAEDGGSLWRGVCWVENDGGFSHMSTPSDPNENCNIEE